jgi:hypothetical protein
MAEVLVEFTDVLVGDAGVRYHAHACGTEMPDGKWQGWLEFVPLDCAPPICSSRETTQPNRADTLYWATGLTAVYLEGALQRASKPLVLRKFVPHEPTFQGPAPTASAVVTPSREQQAVLNPFSICEKGAAVLRNQLTALSARHLVDIIKAYRLSDKTAAVLHRRSAASLIEIIVSAVAGELADSRLRRVSRRVSR